MKAVILAGGLGSRLEPFTQVIPKPLLPIGESSVLEIQILSLKKYGFEEIFIASNYMSEYVRAFVEGGNKYDNIKITFSKEDKPLGTCGPVSLIKDKLNEPFFLINGDILTTLDFEKAFKFSTEVDSNLVVLTKEITAPFNFGKVVSKGNYIVDIQEKPDFKFEILAGIYLLKPPVLDLIPQDTYYGIDNLIKDMLSKKMNISKYVIQEYWLDIGRMDDYRVAQVAYKEHFNHLKKGENGTQR
jgi:NDP-sugar pyrophosphorylase family protein